MRIRCVEEEQELRGKTLRKLETQNRLGGNHKKTKTQHKDLDKLSSSHIPNRSYTIFVSNVAARQLPCILLKNAVAGYFCQCKL